MTNRYFLGTIINIYLIIVIMPVHIAALLLMVQHQNGKTIKKLYFLLKEYKRHTQM